MLTLLVFLLCAASCVSASAKGELMDCCDFFLCVYSFVVGYLGPTDIIQERLNWFYFGARRSLLPPQMVEMCQQDCSSNEKLRNYWWSKATRFKILKWMNPDRTHWPQFQSPIHCQCCSFTQCCLVTSLIGKRKVKKDKTRVYIVYCFLLVFCFSCFLKTSVGCWLRLCVCIGWIKLHVPHWPVMKSRTDTSVCLPLWPNVISNRKSLSLMEQRRDFYVLSCRTHLVHRLHGGITSEPSDRPISVANKKKLKKRRSSLFTGSCSFINTLMPIPEVYLLKLKTL